MSTDLFDTTNPTNHTVGQGQEHHGHVKQQPDLGSPIRFQVWLRHGLLGPAWAALCGALASGGLTLSTEALLRLALLAIMVDVVWGGLWSALAQTDWASPLRNWQGWRHGTPVNFLPYTSPDGPAGRLARNWGHLRSWWVELVQPGLGPTLVGLAVLLPLALVISGVLGTLPLMTTLLAITLLQFVFVRTRGDGRPVPGPQALFEVALPWLAGHTLLESPTLPSVLMALVYALSYSGGIRITHNWSGLTRWNLGQGLAIAVLAFARQPAAAGIAGLLLLGQAIFQPGLFDAETEQVMPSAALRFVRIAQPWLMMAMLAAAWGVGAAGTRG